MLCIPALSAQMGELQYYISLWTWGQAAKNIYLLEESYLEKEHEIALMCKINSCRINREIIPYILKNQEHFFSAITVEVHYPPGNREGINFVTEQEPFGKVLLDGTEELIVIDGQHRLKALKEALKANRELASETLAIIMVPFRTLKDTRNLMGDMKKHCPKSGLSEEVDKGDVEHAT